MNFENEITLYQLSNSGKIKEWSLKIIGNIITTTWGYLDGAKQTTTDIILGKNTGRSNETSNEEQALLEFDRRVKEKKHLGAVELIEDAEASIKSLDDDFFNSPPDSLSLPKPLNSISSSKKYSEKFLIQRKLDGCRAHVFIGTNGNVQIKSRTMKEDKTFHFPKIVSEIKSLGLSNTVLDGEMVVLNDSGVDDFELMTSIWRSDVDKSLDKSSDTQVRFVVFDMPFFDGNDMLATSPYKKRHALAKEITDRLSDTILTTQCLDMSVEDAEKIAVENGWEGLVLWNPEAVNKDAWTINGKPKRPSNFCFKVKVKQDFDVIVESWEYGNGKNKDVLGKWTNAYMLCPKTEQKILICDVGGGMTDSQRKDFMSLQYPLVIKVECDKMNPNGSLRFPVFKSIHEGKSVSECIMEESTLNRLTEVRYV